MFVGSVSVMIVCVAVMGMMRIVLMLIHRRRMSMTMLMRKLRPDTAQQEDAAEKQGSQTEVAVHDS